MILRDGLLGHDDYPASQPVLATPPKAGPVFEPPSVLSDRVHWVTVLRPMLVAAGNLKLTPEMEAEEKAVRAELAKANRKPAQVPVPLTTVANDDDDGEVPF